MENISMSQNNRYKRDNRNRQRHPQYWKVGSTVWLHCPTLYKGKDVYFCEARVVRQPLFYNGPYKIVITGIRFLPGTISGVEVKKLLGLRLRRNESNLIQTRNAFTVDNNEEWIRYSKEMSDKVVKIAISFIKKDKLDQTRGKNAWLISKQARN